MAKAAVSHPRSIVVTGASSGLGAAIAVNYAAPSVTLFLLGRDPVRLAHVAAAVRARGATAVPAVIDVRDGPAMRDFLLASDATVEIDLVGAAAGINVAPEATDDGRDPEAAVFDVNVRGALNAFHPLLPAMRRRGRGQIALVSSLTAIAPQADGVAYSASKAALLAYGLAARDAWRADGIRVNTICPGFVDTPMAASYRGWKPFMIDAETAARHVRRGLERDHGIIAFPRVLFVATRLQQLLPDALRRLAMRAFRYRVGR